MLARLRSRAVGLGSVALNETIRRLAEQVATLNQIRSSAVAVLGIASIGTSFLATVAIDPKARDLPLLAWIAIGALMVAVGLTVAIFWPARISHSVTVETLSQPEWRELDEDDAAFHLAGYLAKRAEKNVSIIDARWRLLILASGATGLSLIAWLTLLAQ